MSAPVVEVDKEERDLLNQVEQAGPGQHEEPWWALDEMKQEEEEQAPDGKHRSKFDISTYVGDKPLTEIPFTELVYASMRWGVDFNWSSEKEVKSYMAHVGYIAMKAMAGLYVSEAMSSYDDSIRKAAELQGTCVFTGYNIDFTLGLLRDVNTEEAQTGEKLYKCPDCGEIFSTLLSLEGHMSHHKQFTSVSAVRDHMHTHKDDQTKPGPVEDAEPQLLDQVFDQGMVTIKSETEVEENQIIEPDINVDVTAPVLEVSNDMLSHNDDALQLSDTEDQAPEEVDATESSHTCSLCGNIFGDTAALKAHMLTHKREKPYAVLHRHLLSRIGGKTHQSPVDNDRLGEPKTLKKHERTQLGYVCSVCGKKCRTPFLLNRHMTMHTGEKPHMCPVCGKKYAQRSHLQRHMMTHTEEKQPHKCRVCDNRFTAASSLKMHMRRAHRGEMPYKCSHCKKGFLSYSVLRVHMRTHTGEKPYQCPRCGEQFAQAGNFNTHKLTHIGHKGHKCSRCGRQFRLPATLKKHIRTHTGEKPHQCPQCDRLFAQSTTLRDHMRTHTGEKPYQCSLCGKLFTQSSNLRSHMKTHSGEKPEKCSDCGKQFRGTSQLKDHMMTHTGERPYQCSECGKQFQRSNGLKRHMMTHTGEKPYTCSACHKQFREAGNLKQHMRTHRGEKAHKRSQSDKQFTQTSAL